MRNNNIIIHHFNEMFLYLTKKPVKTPIFQIFIKTQPTVALKKHGLNLQQPDWFFASNMSKTSASVSSGIPDTEKQMKARGRRPIAFIASRCLEPLMKHKARVFDIAYQTGVRI